MTDVAVIGFAQTPGVRRTHGTTGGVEMLVPLLRQVLDDTGLTKADIGFWCSGSSDYLAGRAFSFVLAVDALGAFPPINESHVEMDGAWALYEAWVKIRTGEVDTALAYGFGKSSAGNLRRVLALQLDPYLVAPLWPDSVSIAALQARLGIEAGLWTEKEMAEVAARSLASAVNNPHVHRKGNPTSTSCSTHPMSPTRCGRTTAPRSTDGAAVVVLASGDRARELCPRPAWISGFAHRVDSGNLGLRDLTTAPSAAGAGRAAGLGAAEFGHLDVAELHAPFTHQEILLRQALGLDGKYPGQPVGRRAVFQPNVRGGVGPDRGGRPASDVGSGRPGTRPRHQRAGPAAKPGVRPGGTMSERSASEPTAQEPREPRTDRREVGA